MPGYKCIGGILDGQRRFISDGQTQLIARIAPKFSARDFDPAHPPRLIESRVELYVVDQVAAAEGKIEFFRPAAWSTEKALRHALT